MKKLIERLLKTKVGQIIIRELYIALLDEADKEAMKIKNPTAQVAVITFLNSMKETLLKQIDEQK